MKKIRKNRLIQCMRVIKKPFNNPDSKATITGLVEVLLPPELRKRLVQVKQSNSKLTYSYVARYCLFRLLRQQRLFSKKKFEELYEYDRFTGKNRATCKRLRLCFYGSDEAMFQLLSIEKRIDMSKLVRIALLWYLPEFEKQVIFDEDSPDASELRKVATFSFAKVKLFGTKVIKQLIVYKEDSDYRPMTILHRSTFFGRVDFW